MDRATSDPQASAAGRAASKPSAPAIELHGLVRCYGDLEAVAGLDLVVPRGSCQGLLGPNGAGKSTTINVLVGLDKPTRGTLSVLGRSWENDSRAIRQAIGVQLQETQLVEKLTCFETLRVFRSFYESGLEPDDVLAQVELEEKRDVHIRKLSGGQKQRLALGCSLVNQPDILFLDEPTTGLDPQARRRVWEIIEEFKKRGGTVLLTTHYMDEAEQLCDHIVIVDHGKSIAEGSPREIIESLGAESFIEFSLTENGVGPTGGGLSESELESLPGVVRVQTVDERTTLHVEKTHQAIPALVSTINNRGFALADLHTHRPTLEDVFVNLTGRQLRDG